MRPTCLFIATLFLLASCTDGPSIKDASENGGTTSKISDTLGIGKFSKVQIGPDIDLAMVDAARKIFEIKCSPCHKLSDEKLVGPGWKGITRRRTPEWIMNFATNVDEMLARDPQAQAQLDICLVRMPNQNLSDEDARHILEFMRKNDAAN
jgi:cytochrome c551/c552